MNKFMSQNGFLTEEGKVLLKPLKDFLSKILRDAEVSSMSVSELRNFGSIILKTVGDEISNVIQEKTELNKKFFNMNDDDFLAFLTAKYGVGWIFKVISIEESKRYREIMAKKMDVIITDMKKRPLIQRNGFRFTPRYPRY